MDIGTGFSKAECLGGLKRIQESEVRINTKQATVLKADF
jgi:hypothetical protein